MKSVRLVAIEREATDSASAASRGDYDVTVLIDVDGTLSRQRITVRARIIAGFDATLLVASEELQALFQDHQPTLHRRWLVGEELRGAPVRWPQVVVS